MKFVQVIPIPVTYSRNLESFFVERSRIVDLLLFSLSLFLRRCRTTETRKPGVPRGEIFPRIYSRCGIFTARWPPPLLSRPPRKIGKAEENADPTKILAPLAFPFHAKDGGNTAPFLPLGGEEEQSWKNRGKIRFGTNEFLVERYSRHLVLLWPRDVVTLWYKRRARVISRAKLLRPRWCIGLTTSEDSARA